jgi:esterase/lipase superfamily enzyme
MQTQYFKFYSHSLGRDMEGMIYGHAGRPMLYIPSQDGRFFDFEGFHMTDTLSPWIESGQLMVFSIDTMDVETWSNKAGNPHWRARRHEQWMTYISEELTPFIRDETNRRNGWDGYPGIIAYGCSLGATHAVNLYFRYPDKFDRLMALSGIYTADYGFDGYMDEIVYANSPVHYLANLPKDHPFIARYNRNKGVICVGQGAWEQPETTRRVQELCQEKGINLWVDFWGWDVNHDWPWWHKQAAYFMPYLLG